MIAGRIWQGASGQGVRAPSRIQLPRRQARHTGRQGLARQALQFAGRAADTARHEPSLALHAFVSLRQAYAQLGDEVEFRSTIAAARRELDRGPHETDPHWTRTVIHSEITQFEAMGETALGAPAQAVRLRQAILDDTARARRDQASNRAGLAGDLVQVGDLNQAIDHGLMILPNWARPWPRGGADARLTSSWRLSPNSVTPISCERLRRQ